ncbi:Uncharacterised protein [Yersinia enterocolitica]|nr:Uncharacterised protein [Yersinia mollaretii]CNK84481.1 Uncharacterised protein [Yersinia enterocolitica]CQQ89792.1 Uncharacterised protein [Yersinia mollaretii]
MWENSYLNPFFGKKRLTHCILSDFLVLKKAMNEIFLVVMLKMLRLSLFATHKSRVFRY